MFKGKELKQIEKQIGYRFKNKELISQAFTHSSYANIYEIKDNERLEFLGDSVLHLSTTKYLYNNFELKEGALSKLRSYVVSTKNLAKAIDSLKIIHFLKCAKENNKNVSNSTKANLFEAILGAIYLDGGFNGAYNFVTSKLNYSKKLFNSLIDNTKDYKTQLQEIIQADSKNKLVYQIIKKIGPPHNPLFTANVLLNGKEIGKGTGNTKKEAENFAAEAAIKKIS